MKRIYVENVDIDGESMHDFYKKRAIEKVSIDIDAPVVLVGDKDKSKIEAWTTFEIEHRLPLLSIDSSSVVLEMGCGTGRISKYITSIADTYIGVDYVKEFIDIIQQREDIKKKDTTHFIHSSFQELMNNTIHIPEEKKFNRFIISGGVLMYMNDNDVRQVLNQLVKKLDDDCIIYLSEPIALQERLTLNKFYSDNLESEYSAIYRTEKEYLEMFDCFFNEGFTLDLSEEFFFEDIKAQKETKQWFFMLQRKEKQ